MTASEAMPAESQSTYQQLNDPPPFHSHLPSLSAVSQQRTADVREEKEQSAVSISRLPRDVRQLSAGRPVLLEAGRKEAAGDFKQQQGDGSRGEQHKDLKAALLHHSAALPSALEIYSPSSSQVPAAASLTSADSPPLRSASPSRPSGSVPPFPWLVVVLLSLINLNEAFQQNVIWPFIPQMIRDFNVGEEADNSFYAGVLGSSYFLAQLLSALAWGVVSDRIGRRPVLLYGTIACTAATLVFGLSSSYPVAVAARFLAGFLSGNLGTTKTYLSEELHRAHLARGLSALGFSAGFGGIVGPVVGGYLNRPAVQYPDSFSSSGLFGQFPYLLPEMLSIAIGLGGFVVSLCYLPESAAFSERQRIIAARSASPSSAADVEMAASPQHQPTPLLAVRHQHQSAISESELRPETIVTVLHRKQVVICCSLYGLQALTFIIYDEMFSFFFEADVSVQGLGYSSARTGSFLAVTGVCLILFQILVFPPLVGRVGVIRLYRLTTLLCVPYFLLFPLLSNVSSSEAVSDWLTVLIISAACCVRAAIGACCFTPVFMLINGSAPQASLGAVNGLGQSLAAFSRTVGPLVGGGVWAASLAWGDWHHLVVYVIAAALAALTYAVSLCLRKKVNEDDPDEEDVAGGSKQRPSRAVVMME